MCLHVFALDSRCFYFRCPRRVSLAACHPSHPALQGPGQFNSVMVPAKHWMSLFRVARLYQWVTVDSEPDIFAKFTSEGISSVGVCSSYSECVPFSGPRGRHWSGRNLPSSYTSRRSNEWPLENGYCHCVLRQPSWQRSTATTATSSRGDNNSIVDVGTCDNNSNRDGKNNELEDRREVREAKHKRRHGRSFTHLDNGHWVAIQAHHRTNSRD